MTSPAQRHMMRVSAIETAQRENNPLRHATAYEQMLVKLAADQRTLKAIFGKELKATKSASCCRSICRGSVACWNRAKVHRMTS